MDDLISRQDAIKAVEKESQIDGAYGYMDTKSIVDLLNDLPSAQPEQKVGKWIKMSDGDGIYWACSECGEDIPRISHFHREFDLFPRLKSIDKTNYCPNCGAKMKGESE